MLLSYRAMGSSSRLEETRRDSWALAIQALSNHLLHFLSTHCSKMTDNYFRCHAVEIIQLLL